MKQIHRTGRNRRSHEIAPAPLVLNGFELSLESLSVPVILYEVRPVRPRNGSDGSAKNAMWRHRGSHRDACTGRGAIIGVTDDVVATTRSWDLPSGQAAGYTIDRKMELTVTAECSNRKLLLALVDEAVKQHFKNVEVDTLGPLWRDYRDYCQMPSEHVQGKFAFCRKFVVRPKILADSRAVLQVAVSTTTLDGRPLSYYYERGQGEHLAELVASAQERYTTRNGDPGRFRVWNDLRPTGRIDARIVDVERPEDLIEFGRLSPSEQRSVAGKTIACTEFPDKQTDVSLRDLRLIIGNWGTGDRHRETILPPEERARLRRSIQSAFEDFAIHDCAASVSP